MGGEVDSTRVSNACFCPKIALYSTFSEQTTLYLYLTMS